MLNIVVNLKYIILLYLGNMARTEARITVSQYMCRPIAFCITQQEPGKPMQLTQTALQNKLKLKNAPNDATIDATCIKDWK